MNTKDLTPISDVIRSSGVLRNTILHWTRSRIETVHEFGKILLTQKGKVDFWLALREHKFTKETYNQLRLEMFLIYALKLEVFADVVDGYLVVAIPSENLHTKFPQDTDPLLVANKLKEILTEKEKV